MAALADRDELAAPSRAAIEALNKRQAAEFRALLGDPPDPKNVPAKFWADIKKENEEALVALLLLIFMTSYDGHRTWGTMEPPASSADRDRIATQWTAKRAEWTAKMLNKRSIDLLDAAGKEWSIKKRADIPVPQSDIDDLIDSIFGEDRIDTIVRTEGQVAVVEGGDAAIKIAVKKDGAKVTKYWGHSGRRLPGHSNALVRPCPVCSPREGLPESQWGKLKPGYCHVACDCYTVVCDADGFVVGTGVPGMIPGNNPNKTWQYRTVLQP